jgi:hypothetical protein
LWREQAKKSRVFKPMKFWRDTITQRFNNLDNFHFRSTIAKPELREPDVPRENIPVFRPRPRKLVAISRLNSLAEEPVKVIRRSSSASSSLRTNICQPSMRWISPSYQWTAV